MRLVVSWKSIAVAAVAVTGYVVPGASVAQLIVDPAGSFRDPWHLSSSIGLDGTWSDNINLSPAGSERSDFVTTVSPSFSMARTGPRLNANLSYSPQFLYYANGTNGSQLRNSLNANLNAALIQNLLFLDATAGISQQNVSPFGTQAANSVNGSTNRAESRYYSIGPTLRSRLENDLTYALGYHYSISSADNNLLATSHIKDAFGNVQTSTSFRDIGFGASFDRNEQDFDQSNSIITENVNATVTYVLQPTIHLRGSIGYDRNRYPSAGQGQPEQSGLSYSGGFDWNPSRHTSFTAQFGHRYFGPTANVKLSETSQHYVLSAIYSRDQTTSTGNGLTLTQNPNFTLLDQFLRAAITDPIARAQAVTNALAQAGLSTQQFQASTFISNQLFLQKRAEISLALLGLKNTVTFDVSRTETRGLSNITVGFDIFNQAQFFRSTVYSANWSHKLGPRTTANVTLQKLRNKALEGAGDTDQRQFVASLNRQFSNKLSGSVLYRNTVQTGDASGAGFFSGNYRENAVLGSLRYNF